MRNKKYVVIFSFAIDVTAKDEDEAYLKAVSEWDKIVPQPYEMNYDIEEVIGGWEVNIDMGDISVL